MKRLYASRRQKLFLSTFDYCEPAFAKFSRIHFTNTLKRDASHRAAPRRVLFHFVRTIFIDVLIGIYFSPARRMVVKWRAGRCNRLMSRRAVSGPNVKTQAAARARDRNVNFGSWSAARVVCHGNRSKMLLATGKRRWRGRGVSTPSQSFSHFHARVAARRAPEQLPTKREITYSPLNIVRGTKPDLEQTSANEHEWTACFNEGDQPADSFAKVIPFVLVRTRLIWIRS